MVEIIYYNFVEERERKRPSDAMSAVNGRTAHKKPKSMIHQTRMTDSMFLRLAPPSSQDHLFSRLSCLSLLQPGYANAANANG